jgi:diguanylate cyclase (GGDEF)-like protein
MSKINVVPNLPILADPILVTTFEQWQSTIDLSGFYLAAEIDREGICNSLLLFNQADIETTNDSHKPIHMVWDFLPAISHGPLKGIISQPLPTVTKRMLQLSLQDAQERWLECVTHDFTDITGESLILLLARETTAERQWIQQALAYHEPVTGLPNRRKAYEVLQHLGMQPASDAHWGLIYIDLDHFKWINEAHGHAAGTSLLQQVAERLQKIVAPHFLACMGGDEFLILLSDLGNDSEAALQQVWLMQRKVQKIFERMFKVDQQKLSITASMGLASFNGLDMRDTDFVKAVDIAMHRAKQAGRNTAYVYEPGMQTEIATQVMLKAELREAIDQQQLSLHYQVQVDHTGRPFGAEALLRWQHPQRGFISPAQFIPVAESSGLIIEIGMWVLNQACAQIALWQRNRKTSDLSLSVNISAHQFKQANFIAMVKNCIQQHQINPNALRLELTESLLLENVDDAVNIMNELSQLGIQFSLDDFGTGYSSLQYLKKLPLYQLKIDRSFVNDIVTDSHDRTIVRTIIAMAQSMYLSVIAEGVETQEQMELLLNNGCRRYQGYLFGKPMPINQFDTSLHQALS